MNIGVKCISFKIYIHTIFIYIYIYINLPGSMSVDYIFFLHIRIVLPRQFSVLPCILCTEVSEEN